MVQVIESTFIVPSEETPRGKLCLSNLEQVAPVTYIRAVHFYKNNAAKGLLSIEVMKAALAKALVLFYPLAGRFVVDDDGRKVIDCNAEGALLVVAQSERRSDEINFKPSPKLRNQFVPGEASSSLMIMLQITYLKCGGVVLGYAIHHVLIDGRSSFQFFQTWARIARDKLASILPPSFDNSLLRPRSPPTVTSDYPEYVSHHVEVKNRGTPSPCVVTELKLSSEQICSLKHRYNEDNTTTRISTFCAISALFWKCYCIAQDLPPHTETRFQFNADIRGRVQPPLPQNFFGNAIIRMSATAQVSAVKSNPVHITANRIKAAIDGITDEYIKSFIDYVEVNQNKKLSAITELPKSDLRISSIAGMPAYEADFGWGAPRLITWAEVIGTNVIYVIDDPEGKDGGLVALVALRPDIVDKFKEAFSEELQLCSRQC